MDIYIIKRTSDGKYVTPPGREQSYSADIREARRFDTPDQARRECCEENEVVTTLAAECGR